MAIIAIIVALIVAAVGVAVGVVRSLIGAALGLVGGGLGLLPHLVPLALITLGIIWLVKGSSPKNAAETSGDRGTAAPPGVKGTR